MTATFYIWQYHKKRCATLSSLAYNVSFYYFGALHSPRAPKRPLTKKHFCCNILLCSIGLYQNVERSLVCIFIGLRTIAFLGVLWALNTNSMPRKVDDSVLFQLHEPVIKSLSNGEIYTQLLSYKILYRYHGQTYELASTLLYH